MNGTVMMVLVYGNMLTADWLTICFFYAGIFCG